MQFTEIPTQHAPLGGELFYAFGTESSPVSVTVRITGTADGAVLGAKRFAGVGAARFDIAPYVRRAVRFCPRVGPTGLYAVDGRVVTVGVEATEVPGPGAGTVQARAAAEDENAAAAEAGTAAEDENAGTVEAGGAAEDENAGAGGRAAGNVAVAPARTFLPVQNAVEGPGWLTQMPLGRLIGPGEADELTLFAEGAGEVVVTAVAGGGEQVRRYPVPEPGLHLFRLDMRDFAGAERVTVDAGVCGAVEYTVIAVPEGARRLAWRSRAGSVEHYTFPAEASVAVAAVKRRAQGPEGYAAVAEERREVVLVSAYECREVLEALAGILTSPQVWSVDAAGYEAIDVLTEKAVVHRHGVLGVVEIAVRPVCKTRLPWN